MHAVHVFLCCYLTKLWYTSWVLRLSQLCWWVFKTLKEWIHLLPIPQSSRQSTYFCAAYFVILSNFFFISVYKSYFLELLISNSCSCKWRHCARKFRVNCTCHLYFVRCYLGFNHILIFRFHGSRAYLDVEVNEFVWNQWEKELRHVCLLHWLVQYRNKRKCCKYVCMSKINYTACL